jgi:uncharacterized protein YpbB
LYENRRETEKEASPDSKTISLRMFEDGMKIEEIAKKRGLAASTVEGHLTKFVRRGELDVHDFLSAKQVEEILAKAEELDDPNFSYLKRALDGKYTYGQLKMAMAHRTFSSEQKRG